MWGQDEGGNIDLEAKLKKARGVTIHLSNYTHGLPGTHDTSAMHISPEFRNANYN